MCVAVRPAWRCSAKLGRSQLYAGTTCLCSEAGNDQLRRLLRRRLRKLFGALARILSIWSSNSLLSFSAQ
jgi:hypothetical protein